MAYVTGGNYLIRRLSFVPNKAKSVSKSSISFAVHMIRVIHRNLRLPSKWQKQYHTFRLKFCPLQVSMSQGTSKKTRTWVVTVQHCFCHLPSLSLIPPRNASLFDTFFSTCCVFVKWNAQARVWTMCIFYILLPQSNLEGFKGHLRKCFKNTVHELRNVKHVVMKNRAAISFHNSGNSCLI